MASITCQKTNEDSCYFTATRSTSRSIPCTSKSIPEISDSERSHKPVSSVPNLEPLCASGANGVGSVFFPVFRHGTPSKVYDVNIEFSVGRLVVDGKKQDLNDPKTIEFIESIRHYECPEELKEPGMYCVYMLLGCDTHELEEAPIDDAELEEIVQRFFS